MITPNSSANSRIVNLPPAGKSEIYEGDLQNIRSSFIPNNSGFRDVEIKDFQITPRVPTVRQVKKMEVSKKLSAIYSYNAERVSPYLEDNAQTWGDFEIKSKIALAGQCGKSVVWFTGQSTGLTYVKKIDCHKFWCPTCGGRNGKIHKHRIHSILKRFDIENYNLRQLVLTVPDTIRQKLMSRENLNLLFSYSKQLAEKFFGEPVFDKKGHVKKYKLTKGVISYLHMFGEEAGIYKPHINLHILEEKTIKLKLDEGTLKAINKYWLKKLRNFEPSLDVVDTHYKFRCLKSHKLHAVKYMSRPAGIDDFNMLSDEMKKFMIMDLNAFLYLRFYGALANCNYKDEFDVQEEQAECESKCGENLIRGQITSFDEESWKNRMVKVDEGFYIILAKNKIIGDENERKKIEGTAEGSR